MYSVVDTTEDLGSILDRDGLLISDYIAKNPGALFFIPTRLPSPPPILVARLKCRYYHAAGDDAVVQHVSEEEKVY